MDWTSEPFRSIANETKFCARCRDEKSNLCRRVLRWMMKLNEERRIEECKVSSD